MGMHDHREVGRELAIFSPDPMLGSGLPVWLPAGAAVRGELERFVVEAERRAGYAHVYTPPLGKQELYERSGHWANFADDMFPPMEVGGERLVLRPMNCPHHCRVYASAARSHRELPVRIAELGAMFRLERSGVVGGLSRVRHMTLNDGHVFCRPEQLGEEIGSVLAMIGDAYDRLGIAASRYRLSLRGTGGKYAGDHGMWERAEAVLRASLDDAGVAYEVEAGEAAFYGPKVDVQVRDHRGREETLSTVQVDYLLPSRFALEYRAADGSRPAPVLVHRSVVSTMERMVAHLLEVHGAALPVWLAPVHLAVLPVTDDQQAYAAELVARAVDAGLRAELRDASDTLGARVRAAAAARIPYVAVVGEREEADRTVSVRLRDGSRLDPVPAGELAARAAAIAAARRAGAEWT